MFKFISILKAVANIGAEENANIGPQTITVDSGDNSMEDVPLSKDERNAAQLFGVTITTPTVIADLPSSPLPRERGSVTTGSVPGFFQTPPPQAIITVDERSSELTSKVTIKDNFPHEQFFSDEKN